MNDHVAAYFIYKTFTSKAFWAFCGIIFLYNLVGQSFTKLSVITKEPIEKISHTACRIEQNIESKFSWQYKYCPK